MYQDVDDLNLEIETTVVLIAAALSSMSKRSTYKRPRKPLQSYTTTSIILRESNTVDATNVLWH